MSTSRASAGRIGGLIRAATAESPRAITEAARRGRWQKYLDLARQVAPEGASEADIIRRAGLLQRADMVALSQRAADARARRAAARRAPQFAEGEPDG